MIVSSSYVIISGTAGKPRIRVRGRDNVWNSFGRAARSHKLRRLPGVVARVRIGCIIGCMVDRRRLAGLDSRGPGVLVWKGGRRMVVPSAQEAAAWAVTRQTLGMRTIDSHLPVRQNT